MTEQSRPGGEGAYSGQIPKDIHFAQRRYNDYAQFSADEYNGHQRFHLDRVQRKARRLSGDAGIGDNDEIEERYRNLDLR